MHMARVTMITVAVAMIAVAVRAVAMPVRMQTHRSYSTQVLPNSYATGGIAARSGE
jgi:hypothetical protein